MIAISRLSGLLLLAHALHAQSVLRVGPTRTFTNIQAAVTAAMPGDVVLIDGGSYPAFTLGKELILRAWPTNTVVSAAGITITDADSAVVEGIAFPQPVAIGATRISFHGCSFAGGIVATDAAVNMVGCAIGGGLPGQAAPAAFAATGTTALSAVQCSFTGGTHPALAADGISASGSSRLHLNGCTVRGGVQTTQNHGGDGICFGDIATGWLADCSLSCGLPSGGSPGLSISSSSTAPPVHVDRCIRIGSITSSFVLMAPSVGIAGSAVLQRGASATVTVRTAPGYPVGLHVSFELGLPAANPLLVETEWGLLAASQPWSFAVADGNGIVSTPLAVPNDPALAHLRVWLCAWSGVGFPLNISSPLGAMVR